MICAPACVCMISQLIDINPSRSSKDFLRARCLVSNIVYLVESGALDANTAVMGMLKTLALSLAELSREMTSSANTTSSAATAGATASSTSAPMSSKTSNPTLRLASNDAVGYNVAAFCTLCSLVVELARSCISQLAPMTHKHLIETILQLLQRGVLTSRRSHEKTQAPAATPSVSSGTFATAAAATPVSSNASENAVVLPAHHQQSLSTARSIIVGLKRQRDDNEYQDLRDNGNGSSASVNDGAAAAAAAAAARRASTKINDTSAATLSSTVNDRLRLIGSCIELLQLLLAHPHVSLSHYSAMMQVSSTVSLPVCVYLVRID